MRTLKLTIEYDGTRLVGWQRQAGGRSAQGLVEEAITRLEGGPVTVEGAGRTDAGVHALGQVAHFRTHSALALAQFARALNALLPPTVRVLAAEEVAADFHARHHAVAKTYSYRIYRGNIVPPFLWRYVWHYPYPLDEAAMGRAASLIQGEHDFASFAAPSGESTERHAGDREPTTVRTILSSELLACRNPVPLFSSAVGQSRGADTAPQSEEDYQLVYRIRGRSFLRYMVRKLVGTLVEVGRGRMTPDDLARLFALRDPSRSGPTAPPQGLFLEAVEYSTADESASEAAFGSGAAV
jgi:tRNA pseudouridine38-40 synthase